MCRTSGCPGLVTIPPYPVTGRWRAHRWGSGVAEREPGPGREGGEMEGLERPRGTRPRLRSQSCSGQPSPPIQRAGLLPENRFRRPGAGVGRDSSEALGAGLHGAAGQGLEMEAQEWGEQEEGTGQAVGAAQGGRPIHVAQVSVAAGHRPGPADAVHVRGHALAGTGLGHCGVPQEGVHWGHRGTGVRLAPKPQPSLLPQHPLWLSPSVTWPLPPSTTIVPGARSDLFRMPRGVRPLRDSPARLQEPPIPGRRVRKEGGSLAAWTKSSFWKCPRWWLLSAHRAWAGGSSDPGTCSPRPTDLSPGSRVWSCTWSR